MTNENNNLENTVEVKNECFCKSKGFRKFLIVAGGTFVGAFCALSLFAALHKPPMPPCPMGAYMMRPPIAYHHYNKFDRVHHKPFCRKIERRDFEKKDFDKKLPVRVNVENKD